MKASHEDYALFAQWLDLDADARADLLERLRSEMPQRHRTLLALIEADRGADRLGFLSGRALDGVRENAVDPAPELNARRIGNWQLVCLLGTGGMGSVWLAHRSDGLHDGRAAIKMLRAATADAWTQQRFAREGRILARLVHPHIAMLLDMGISVEGERYLVLEYVEGQRIDAACDDQRLDLAERLRLFLQVCDAVVHAHVNLIVHRDLKPSNILVQADGNVKLLDFGIAKLLEADADAATTEETSPAMTPAYAAPEQISGLPVTTATDVYALGAVLFRLLRGASPYGGDDAHVARLARRIVEDEPARLSTFADDNAMGAIAAQRRTTPQRLRRALRGDLETIVAKALKKSPGERYASVQTLADDIRRYLERRPILARHDSLLYRIGKYARRHAIGVAACTAILLLAAASAATLARSAAATAREARATAAVKDFLFGLFASVDPTVAKGREISARELLDRGRRNLDGATNDPTLHAELETVLGRIYGQLGQFASARELGQSAVAELEAQHAPPIRIARAQIDLGNALRELGELDAAKQAAEDAQARIVASALADATDRVRALTLLGKIEVDRRDFTAAKRHADAAVTLARSARIDAPRFGDSLATLGNAEWGMHEFAQAESAFREAMRVYAVDPGADSPMVGRLHSNLALALNGQSRYADALEENRRALAILQPTLGAGHKAVIATRGAIGLSQYHLGDYRGALATLSGVANARRADAGSDDIVLAGILINLGQVQIEMPDLAAAEASFAESLRIFEKKYGRDYQGTRLALSGLGNVHVLLGDDQKALAELGEVRRIDDRLGEHDDQSNTYWLGEAYRLQHDAARAIEFDREALASAQRVGGERSRYTAQAHHFLGRALRDSGDVVGAENEFRASLASFEYLPRAEHPKAATLRLELAELLCARAQDREEALRLIREAAAIREKFLGTDATRTREARDLLERGLCRQQ